MTSTPPRAEFNPYAAPETDLRSSPGSTVGGRPEIVAARLQHRDKERLVKYLASLHVLAGFFCVLCMTLVVISYVTGKNGDLSHLRTAFAVYFTLSVSLLGLGTGLASLHAWARWVDVVLFVIATVVCVFAAIGETIIGRGLTGPVIFGLLSVIPLTVLKLLLPNKSAIIFLPYYRSVVGSTPEHRPRMLFGFLVLAVPLLLGAAWFIAAMVTLFV